MVANGTIPLTPFAAAVYQAVAPDGLGKPVTVSNDDLARIQPSDTEDFVPEDWPTAIPSRANGTPCAVLETVDGKPAVTHLGDDVGRLAVRQAGQQAAGLRPAGPGRAGAGQLDRYVRVRSPSSTSPARRSPSPTRRPRRWPGSATRTSPRATSRRPGCRCCRPVRRSARPRSAHRRSTRAVRRGMRRARFGVAAACFAAALVGLVAVPSRRPLRLTAPAPSSAPGRSTSRSVRPR